MVDRRVWWGAGVLIAGIGAAVLTGSATASADEGTDTGKPATSETSTHGPEKPSPKLHSPRGAAAATTHDSVSTPGPDLSALNQPVHTVNVAQSLADRLNRVTVPESAPLKKVVLRVTAALDDPAGDLADNPVSHGLVKLTAATPSETTAPAATPGSLRELVKTAALDTANALLDPPSNPVAPASTPLPTAVDLTALKQPVTARSAALQAPIAPQTLAAIANATPSKPIVIQAPPTLGPIASAVLNILSSFGWKPQPFVVSLFPALKPWVGVPVPTPIPAVSVPTDTPPTTAPAVLVGHSTLTIPCGPGYTARVDWYFPAQADGTVNPQGVIWLQHGFLANSSFYSALATNLAAQTNSIVVVPTLTSNPLACAGCWLNGTAMQQAAATLFIGDRTALNESAAAAGFVGTLPDNYILAGHSAGGNFAAAVAGYVIANGAAVAEDGTNLLRGVVMFDGVTNAGVLSSTVPKLNDLGIPIYQIAGRNQIWNAFGTGTNDLLKANPGRFDGVVLVGGSHVDSMLGSNPIIDFFAQLITKFSPPGNTNAVYVFADGWINDMYAGNQDTGLYPGPGETVQIGRATAVGLPAPWAQLAPIQKLFNAIASFFENLFGFLTGDPSAKTSPAVAA